MPHRTPDDLDAWIDLPDEEHDGVWDRVYETFDFTPGVDPIRWPSFREPSSSITWNIDSRIGDLDHHELEVAALLRDALDAVVGDDEYVYALDWQHPGYRLVPSLASAPKHVDSWLVPALPDGDYYLFVARDLRFGWLGHPVGGFGLRLRRAARPDAHLLGVARLDSAP
jgi:Protein of unknown function (DUF2716)